MTEGTAFLETSAQLVVQALLNGLWQGVLLALVVAAGMVFLRRKSAATRHLIWTVTLLVVAALPIAGVWRGNDATVALIRAAEVAAAPSGLDGAWPVAAPPDRAAGPGSTQLVELPGGSWLIAVLGVIVLVSVAKASSLVMSLRRLRRLKLVSRPVPLAIRAGLEALRKQHVGSHVELRVSDAIRNPLTLGFARPVVLLPAGLLEELAEDELRQITLHELAHLRRYDHWNNLVQRAIEAVFFFHPAVWWMGRRLELERELACDEYTLQHLPGARAYVRCLARIAEDAVHARELKLAPGAVSGGSQLSWRVRALLAPRRSVNARTCIGSSAGFIAGLIAASIALVQTAPVLGIRAVPAATPTLAGVTMPSGVPQPRARQTTTGEMQHLGESAEIEPPASTAASLAAPHAAQESRGRVPAGAGGGNSPADAPDPPQPSLAMHTVAAIPAPVTCAASAAAGECAPLDAAVAEQREHVSSAGLEEPVDEEPEGSREESATPSATGGKRPAVRIDIAVALPFLPRARPVRSLPRPQPGALPAQDYGTPVGTLVEAIRGEQLDLGRAGSVRLSVRGSGPPLGRRSGLSRPW